jgi:hypothetical protein
MRLALLPRISRVLRGAFGGGGEARADSDIDVLECWEGLVLSGH